MLVFSYYYSSNTIQIAKGKKYAFYSNLFSLLNSVIIFFVGQRFLGVYTIFWKSSSPCFSFEVNNNFLWKVIYQWNHWLLGFLMIWKPYFQCFATKSILFLLLFLGHIGMEVNKPCKLWSHCHQIFISVQTIRYLC